MASKTACASIRDLLCNQYELPAPIEAQVSGVSSSLVVSYFRMR